MPSRSRPSITLMGVGDIIINNPKPASAFTHVRPVFEQADILFGNQEAVLTERGSRNPIGRGAVRTHPRSVEALTYGGFDVVSFANNHHLDWGYEGFQDTLDLLQKHGIRYVGAGKDLDEARTPVVITRGGIRVAFLAYAPVTFMGYEAGPGKLGSAPMRIHTVYRQVEHEQPGTPPDILTFAEPAHVAMMREDIQKARSKADVVVLSFHWGLHFKPVVLAAYESEVGRAAIDAGADLILGHHQHILKAIEVYKGKVIFHGLGNFAMSVYMDKVVHGPGLKEMTDRYGDYAIGVHGADTGYPFHPDARRTMIAKAVLSKKGVQRVSFIPCLINSSGAPEWCRPGTRRFNDVAQYVERITRQAGFQTRLRTDNSEIVIQTATAEAS